MFIGMHLRKYDEESHFLPQAEEEMNDTGLFFYKSLPELRQGLSAGIVKRIYEAFPRFYLMH